MVAQPLHPGSGQRPGFPTSRPGTKTPAPEPAPAIVLDPAIVQAAERYKRFGRALMHHRWMQIEGFIRRASGPGGGAWALRSTYRPTASIGRRAYVSEAQSRADEYRDEQGDHERAARQEAERRQQEQGRQEAANWASWEGALLGAARQGINDWIAKACVVTGTIDAGMLHIPPGAFQSLAVFSPSIASRAEAAGVPSDVAGPFASTIWRAWARWTVGWSLESYRAFPAFAAVALPLAPVTRCVPIPLTEGRSFFADELSEDGLRRSLREALASVTGQVGANQAIANVASRFAASFRSWRGGSRMENIYGWGPVPTFAPPYVPCGPVVGGTAVSPNVGPLPAGSLGELIGNRLC